MVGHHTTSQKFRRSHYQCPSRYQETIPTPSGTCNKSRGRKAREPHFRHLGLGILPFESVNNALNRPPRHTHESFQSVSLMASANSLPSRRRTRGLHVGPPCVDKVKNPIHSDKFYATLIGRCTLPDLCPPPFLSDESCGH